MSFICRFFRNNFRLVRFINVINQIFHQKNIARIKNIINEILVIKNKLASIFYKFEILFHCICF